MGIPTFLRDLRASVGHSLLVLPAVVGVVFDEDRRVLLVRHTNDGKWVMPGGIVEPDEHPARRVVEEMLEETGLRVEPLRLLGVHGGPACRVTYSNGDLVSYVVTAYECRVVSGTPTPNGEETLEVRYVAEDEIATLDLSTIGHANVRVAFGDIGVFDTAS